MTALAYFPLFVNDWLSSASIQRMTLEEQGAFLRLLCFGWTDDGIPADRRELALLIGCEPGSEKAERILTRVLDLAWQPDADNPRKLRNPRQELVREKCSALYAKKVSALAVARSRNPKNRRAAERRKALPRRGIQQAINAVITPAINAEGENLKPNSLKRGTAALSSEHEQRPHHGGDLPARIDWRSHLTPPPGHLRHRDDGSINAASGGAESPGGGIVARPGDVSQP